MYSWGRALKDQLLSAVALHRPPEDVGFRLDWLRRKREPRSRKAARRSADLFRIETIEPRLLLSADLAPGAEQALLKGLTDFAHVLDPTVAAHDAALGAALPMINRNVAEMIDLGALVQTIESSTSSYFTTSGHATSAGLAATLDALSQTVGAVTNTSQGTLEKFSLTVTEAFDPAPYVFDLSGAVHGLDLTVQGNPNLTVTGQHSLTFTFGIDTVTNEFVLFPASFSASVNAAGSNLNFGLIFGLADTQVIGSNANLVASITGNVVDPGNLDGRGVITDRELTATPADLLLDAHVSGTGALSLPTSGGLLPQAETVSLGWTGDLGPTSATATYANNSTLASLGALTQSDLSELLEKGFAALPGVLAEVGPTGVGADTPLLGSQVNGLIDLSSSFQPLTQSLPSFHSLSELESILQQRFGGTVDIGLSGSQLTLKLGIEKSFSTTVSAEVAAEVAGQGLSFSGPVAAQGTVSGQVTFGIALSPGIADGDRLTILGGTNSFVDLDVSLATASPLNGTGHLAGAIVDVADAAVAMSGLLDPASNVGPSAGVLIHVGLGKLTSDGAGHLIASNPKLREFQATPDLAIGQRTVSGNARFEGELQARYVQGAAPVSLTLWTTSPILPAA